MLDFNLSKVPAEAEFLSPLALDNAFFLFSKLFLRTCNAACASLRAFFEPFKAISALPFASAPSALLSAPCFPATSASNFCYIKDYLFF